MRTLDGLQNSATYLTQPKYIGWGCAHIEMSTMISNTVFFELLRKSAATVK